MLNKKVNVRLKYDTIIYALLSFGILMCQSVFAWAEETKEEQLTQQVKQILTLSLPKLEGSVAVAGLAGEVSIARDENGIPTINAENRQAAMYALGFLHGQERFFQMDLLRRRSSGELSALIGATGLSTDQAIRPFLLRKKAQQAITRMSEQKRQMLAAYTDGVNAGLTQLQHSPFEYTFLGVKPESWKSEDSLLTVASLYFDLQDNQAPREYARGWIRDHSTDEQTAFILPVSGQWDVPAEGNIPPFPQIPDGEKPDWWGKTSDTIAMNRKVNNSTLNPADFIQAQKMDGSNGWVVQRQNVTVLANDMHLSRTLPGIWYKVSLKYPSESGQLWRITGTTLPGVPAVVTGSNQKITWGFTNGYVDTFDWVKLSEDTPVQSQVETIEVNQGEAVPLTVKTSEFGPVYQTGMGPMAMHWILDQPGGFDLQLVGLAESNNIFDAMQVANRSGIPVQNLLVADVSGNIGWTLAGKLPQRMFSRQDYSFPLLDVASSRWEAGGKPAAMYPRVVNPRSGVIIAANNHMLFTPQGYVLGDGGFSSGLRAYSIKQALDKLDKVDVQSMYQLQHDNTDYLLQEWRSWLQSCLASADPENQTYQTMRKLLAEWDGTADKNSTAYALLNSWRNRLYSQLFDKLDEEFQKGWPGTTYNEANRRWDEMVHRLMLRNQWVPDDFTSWTALSMQLLNDAWVTDLKNGTLVWGDFNQRAYGHLLAPYFQATLNLPFLNELLQVPPVALSGNASVIHVNRPDFGASDQQVVQVGDEANSILSLPNGPSGNPGSPWWFSGLDDWHQSEPQSLLPGKTKYELVLEGAEE